MSYLHKKMSVGISTFQISANQWKEVLVRYAPFIHDIYFSPVDNMDFQSRRTIYNFKDTTAEQRQQELDQILTCARDCDIKLKLVLNSKEIHEAPDECINSYIFYKNHYNVEYVTTYLDIARKIKEVDKDAKIICSFNQGIRSLDELSSIISENIFYGVVLGERFLHNFQAFKMLNNNNVICELLVNNGCMLECGCFCVKNVPFCRTNFMKNLTQKGLVHLYAETSILPEELTLVYAPSKCIDIYKISTRPTHYSELVDMMESYSTGQSRMFIEKDLKNYHLYCRLTHFAPYYDKIKYEDLIYLKKQMWKELGFWN